MEKLNKPRGKPFQPGDRRAGRPKGATNKASRELKEFWRAFFDSDAYRASLMLRITRGKAPHMETQLHHYVYGKPQDTMKLEGDIGVNVSEIRESIASRIARLSARLGANGVAGNADRS